MQRVEEKVFLRTCKTWDGHYARVMLLLFPINKTFPWILNRAKRKCADILVQTSCRAKCADIHVHMCTCALHTYRLPASYLQRENQKTEISSFSAGSRWWCSWAGTIYDLRCRWLRTWETKRRPRRRRWWRWRCWSRRRGRSTRGRLPRCWPLPQACVSVLPQILLHKVCFILSNTYMSKTKLKVYIPQLTSLSFLLHEQLLNCLLIVGHHQPWRGADSKASCVWEGIHPPLHKTRQGPTDGLLQLRKEIHWVILRFVWYGGLPLHSGEGR